MFLFENENFFSRNLKNFHRTIDSSDRRLNISCGQSNQPIESIAYTLFSISRQSAKKRKMNNEKITS